MEKIMPNDLNYELDMTDAYEECWEDCCGDDYDSFDDFLSWFGLSYEVN